MDGKSPKFYKDKWYNHYKKIADSRGIKFTKRHWERIESGFAFKEWALENKKKNELNDIFQWHYTDIVQELMCCESYILKAIKKEPTHEPKARKMYLYKKEWWENRSHAELWIRKLD